MDRIPKLRLKTSGIFSSRSGPLSAGFSMNSRNSSRAPSPGLLSPEFAYSINTTSNMSTSTLQTPSSAPYDWGMAGVKEVNEEEENYDHGIDVDMK